MYTDDFADFKQCIDEKHIRSIGRLLAARIRPIIRDMFHEPEATSRQTLKIFFVDVMRKTGDASGGSSADYYDDLVKKWAAVGNKSLILATYYYLHTTRLGQSLALDIDRSIFCQQTFAERYKRSIPGGYIKSSGDEKKYKDIKLDIDDYEIPNEIFSKSYSKGFNIFYHTPEEAQIEARIQIEHERKNRTGVINFCHLKIDMLPPEIADLHWLKYIIGYKSNILRLNGIEHMYKLEVLCFDKSRLVSLEALKNCINLRHLNVNTTRISSLMGIEHCTRLQELYFYETHVHNLSPVKNLINIRRMYINHAVPDLLDIPNLRKCVFLNWRSKKFEGPFES